MITFIQLINCFYLVSLIILIVILRNPKKLNKFFKRPTKAKVLGVWLVIVTIVYYIFTLTPEGKVYHKQIKAEIAEKQDQYYYTKPDTTKPKFLFW